MNPEKISSETLKRDASLAGETININDTIRKNIDRELAAFRETQDKDMDEFLEENPVKPASPDTFTRIGTPTEKQLKEEWDNYDRLMKEYDEKESIAKEKRKARIDRAKEEERKTPKKPWYKFW